MKYTVRLCSANMRHFIKLIARDRAVDATTFWFMCQQASGLDKKLRKTGLKCLSRIRYDNEDDLRSLLVRDKNVESLFIVRESNWVKQDN
jgi:hypothetical protein